MDKTKKSLVKLKDHLKTIYTSIRKKDYFRLTSTLYAAANLLNPQMGFFFDTEYDGLTNVPDMVTVLAQNKNHRFYIVAVFDYHY